jgi:hypothetical protein
MIAPARTDTRELARRTNDGIEVALFWSKSSSQITIMVFDTRTDEALEFEVAGEVALDAFRHPYARAAVQSVRSAIGPEFAAAR